MSAPTEDVVMLTPIKRALVEIRDLRARLTALEGAAAEPIAVVGLACRLPGGVHDDASLWRVLSEGIDTISEVPADRWDAQARYDADPDRPATMSTRAGGFLDDIAGFDAALFGIAPREAASMDPQQRLMLEVAWEALEDAAIAPDSLVGSATGVFFGVGNSDYGRMLFNSPDHIDAYAGSGGSYAVIAGRLSYVLGLQGPAMAIDTACSASLVAVHLACQSLRARECDLALSGGVNVIVAPDAHVAFSKARMLSPDGRCKAFDAAADGYGRGEGAAVIVLRRLSDARTRGERVLALIRGSAVNQDGRSSGLTAPNGPAQEAVIRAALANAGLSPPQIDYVEAHGTGTELGDPIELQALAVVFADGRPAERPLLVGSCKINFGHLEAAAGVAGLLKVIAGLRRRQIPPHLHFSTPNPLVDWANIAVCVPTRLQAWPGHAEPARAGVSSFGFSGTNAHVVLEEAPPPPALAKTIERPLHVLTLSARDDAGLRALIGRFQACLADGPPITDVCFTANSGRAQLARRVAVRGASSAELDAGLAALLAGTPRPGAASGSVGIRAPVVAFLFTGQGAQYDGMARGLYQTSPVFRSVIDRCAAALGDAFDLVGVLYGDGPGRIDDTVNAQPALFAVEVALAELWRSWGIEPAVMAGHSLGEYAAACVAGVLSVEAGVRLLAARGTITQALPGEGAMASVSAPPDVVAVEIAALGGALSIAAYNGPQHVVVSGARPTVTALVERLSRRGLECRLLRISHAFHSPMVEPALAPYAEALAQVRFAPARGTVISNLTGRAAGPDELASSAYWLQHMRAPVRFEECVRAALAHGVTHVVEIGPHPVLLGMAADCVAPDSAVAWLPSLRREAPEWTDLLDGLQQLYVAGARIDWAGFDRGYARRRIAVPTTPFQHRRYWIDWAAPARVPAADAAHGWDRVAAALTRQAGLGPIGVDLSKYAATWPCLERLTIAHSVTVLRAAGLFTKPGDRATVNDVVERLGAPATYRHLLERWLQRLAASQALRLDLDAYVDDKPLADPWLAECIAEARDRLSDDPALLAYIERCGETLHGVLAGRDNALDTLFPNGSFEMAEELYARSGPMRYSNALAAGALEALIAARPPRAPLRVLEIGAGTGGTASSLIPLCPASSTTYWFTDVTPVFLDRARDKYAAWPFVRFAELDLDRDPVSQGFAPGSFDLIVAANAVHATRNLRDALRAIRSLLAPGGVVLLIEATVHLAWFDMTTGLIEGWRHFADDLRDNNPLLPPAAWVGALHDAGFDQAGAWPPDGSPPAAMGQSVIAAWVAGAAVDADPAADLPVPAGSDAAPVGAAGFALSPAALRERLAAAMPDEQLDLLRDYVRERVVRVLGMTAAETPDRHDRLMDLGLDSLMAVQLRNLLGKGLGLARPLSATLMFDHPTIESLAVHLQQRIVVADSVQVTSPIVPSFARIGADDLAAMSESDVEALLLSRLGNR